MSDVKEAIKRKQEEAFYNQVAQELREGNKDDAVWAKALAKAKGNSEHARGLYIDFRIQSLKDDMIILNALNEKEEIRRKEAKQTQAKIRQNKEEVDTPPIGYPKLFLSLMLLGVISFLLRHFIHN